METEKRLLKIQEAAAFLNISPHTIRKQLQENRCTIPGLVRLGRSIRFDRRRLEEFIDEAS